MNLRIAMLAAACIGTASLAVAQQSPPAHDTSSPSASTPAQTEAPTSTDTSPSAASSPSQRQALAKGSSDKMMKDCIAKQRSQDSSLSKSDAKKSCKEQMKSTSEPVNR
jgi:hypothetical protein